MVTVNQIENKYLVSFCNVSKLNILNSKEIESQILPLVCKKDSNLILNFSGIKFIDSSGFEVLMNIYKESRLYESDVDFINLSDELMELVKLVELDQVFHMN
jgi:anti-sigma B factor antagonist